MRVPAQRCSRSLQGQTGRGSGRCRARPVSTPAFDNTQVQSQGSRLAARPLGARVYPPAASHSLFPRRPPPPRSAASAASARPLAATAEGSPRARARLLSALWPRALLVRRYGEPGRVSVWRREATSCWVSCGLLVAWGREYAGMGSHPPAPCPAPRRPLRPGFHTCCSGVNMVRTA